jgi:hypothetical protein
MQALLQPGQTVAARGMRLDTALGSVIDVRAIGYSPDQLSELIGGPPPPPRGPNRGRPGAFAPPAPDFDPPPPPPPPPSPRG